MVQARRTRATRASLTTAKVDFELACERYGRVFANRLREHFGTEMLGKAISSLKPGELSAMRPKISSTGTYRRILKEISQEFMSAMKGPAMKGIPKGYATSDAVARIVLYGERAMMRDSLALAGFESKWAKAVDSIEGIMKARLEELKFERAQYSRSGATVSDSLKNRIARYNQLTKDRGKLVAHIRESFSGADNMRDFFEKIFDFDPNHVGFLDKGKRRQMMIGLGDNALDKGINKLAFSREFSFIGEMGIRLKMVPAVLRPKFGARAMQEALSAEVVAKILASAGGAEELMKRAIDSRIAVVNGILRRVGASPEELRLSRAGARGVQVSTEEGVLAALRAQAAKARGGMKVGMVALAAVSLAYLLESSGGGATPQSIPKKVK